MTTIREFVNSNLGGRIEYDDNSYKYQCVDLAKSYINEITEESVGYLGDAKNNYKNAKDYGFTSYDYDGKNKPKRGDVISFKANAGNGYAGHVGIVMAYYKEDVYVLEQNGGKNSSTGTGSDAIRVEKRPLSEVLGWARYKDIKDVVKNDKFDKIVYEKGLYIGENDLKRRDVVEAVFYFLAGYKEKLNGKTFNNLGINSRLNDATTRQELAYIILAFLKKIRNMGLTLENLKNLGIWNGQRPNEKVTGYEFTLMLNKTIELFGN